MAATNGQATSLRPGPDEGDRADQGLRQRRAEAHGAGDGTPLDRGGARDGSARRADPSGVLLRHAGSDAEPARRRRSRPAGAEEGGRLRRQAPAGRPVPAPGGRAQVAGVRRRGRRDARRLRLLGVDEGDTGTRRPGDDHGPTAEVEALLEGATGVLRRAAPEGIELDDLSVLGPIFVLKLKYLPKAFDRRLVAEMWLYPDGSRILELSTKCAPDEAFQVAAETRAFLAGKGVDLGGEQETKTRKALEFFAEAS